MIPIRATPPSTMSGNLPPGAELALACLSKKSVFSGLSSSFSSVTLIFFLGGTGGGAGGLLRTYGHEYGAHCRSGAISFHVIEAQSPIRVLIILAQDLLKVPTVAGQHVGA